MRRYLYSIITDKRKDPLAIIIKIKLYILSLIYGLAIRIVLFLYRKGILKSHKLPDAKIISVGNITWGGVGKTPFVIMLAEELIKLNKRPAVLIRGYGEDESAMLREKLGGVPILVGRDRVATSRILQNVDTIILDDGFQHWRLSRDLDIVLIDGRNPFGNGHMLPCGILREPLSGLGRADIFVITKIDEAKADLEKLEKRLSSINPHAPICKAAHKIVGVFDANGERQLGISGRNVFLLASIGDPEYFKVLAKDAGAYAVGEIFFQDHHRYNKWDIKKIAALAKDSGAEIILTTEKDAAKLKGLLEFFILKIKIEIVEGKEGLIDRLSRLHHS